MAARSSSFQYRMSVKRRSAQRRDGRGVSRGKIEQPVGTVMVSTVDSANQLDTSAKLSQYSRADEAPVPVSQ